MTFCKNYNLLLMHFIDSICFIASNSKQLPKIKNTCKGIFRPPVPPIAKLPFKVFLTFANWIQFKYSLFRGKYYYYYYLEAITILSTLWFLTLMFKFWFLAYFPLFFKKSFHKFQISCLTQSLLNSFVILHMEIFKYISLFETTPNILIWA